MFDMIGVVQIAPWLLYALGTAGVGAGILDLVGKWRGQSTQRELGLKELGLAEKRIAAEETRTKEQLKATRESTKELTERLQQEKAEQRQERGRARADTRAMQQEDRQLAMLGMIMQAMQGQQQSAQRVRESRAPAPPMALTSLLRRGY